MPSLLDSLSQLVTPDALGQLSRAAGMETSQTKKGLEVVGPLLLGGLARTSQNTSGLDAIMRQLPDAAKSGLLDQVLGFAKQSTGSSAPAGLLGSILGPGAGAVGKVLAGRLGFDVGPLLAMAAPAVMGLLSSTAKEQKLNSTDLAQLLQRESTAASAAIKPEVKAVLDEAFSVSDRAQKLKASFTNDEWLQIRRAPMAVTFYVATASESGKSGLAKEVVASGETMKALAKDALPTSLVDTAFGGYDGKLDLEAQGGLDDQSPRSSALGIVQSAMAAVRAKSPVDAKSLGDTLLTLSRKVAEASKEGGFLGIGGTLVSKEEEQAIAELTAAIAGNVARA